jgi:hypothetical protein
LVIVRSARALNGLACEQFHRAGLALNGVGERWRHMSYWIPAAIFISYVIFWFAMTERMRPASMRLRTRLHHRLTKRRAMRATSKPDPT